MTYPPASTLPPTPRRHEAGNVGVEHAAPDTIRTCLRRARPGFGPGRTEFTAEGLQADGLIGVWNDKTKVGAGSRGGVYRTLLLEGSPGLQCSSYSYLSPRYAAPDALHRLRARGCGAGASVARWVLTRWAAARHWPTCSTATSAGPIMPRLWRRVRCSRTQHRRYQIRRRGMGRRLIVVVECGGTASCMGKQWQFWHQVQARVQGWKPWGMGRHQEQLRLEACQCKTQTPTMNNQDITPRATSARASSHFRLSQSTSSVISEAC